MIILGIETSCDETAAAILKKSDGREIAIGKPAGFIEQVDYKAWGAKFIRGVGPM